MTALPRVSVVIPAYNAVNSIERTLNSLFSQSFRDFEIIVVNDGSSDGTLDICKKMQKCSPVVMEVYHQLNKGGSSARNKGVALARGEYIIFLDADDLAEKDYVLKLMQAIESKPSIDIACCSYDLLYEDGSFKPRLITNKNKILRGRDALLLLLTEKLEVWSGSAIYRRSMLTGFNIYFNESISMGEDIEFRWRAFYHARDVALIPKVLVHYVQHDSSITRALDPKRFPPSSWLDPRKFLDYLKACGEKDERLIFTLQNCVMPMFAVRRFRNYVAYGIDDLFWDTLGDKEMRNTLKRGFKSFMGNPELAFKCFLLLCFPEVFYRRYKSQKGNRVN